MFNAIINFFAAIGNKWCHISIDWSGPWDEDPLAEPLTEPQVESVLD